MYANVINLCPVKIIQRYCVYGRKICEEKGIQDIRLTDGMKHENPHELYLYKCVVGVKTTEGKGGRSYELVQEIQSREEPVLVFKAALETVKERL